VAQLVQRLRDQDARVTPALLWLEERLGCQGTDCDGAVRAEHQRQGTMNVSVRNIITSMRLISAMDWAELFEKVSLVDATLRAGSDFAAMDFATRDRYRGAIESLARGSSHSELEIARLAIARAREAAELPRAAGACAPPRASDPGYHLIAAGRPALERALAFRAPFSSWLDRLNARIGIGGYVAVIMALALAFLAFALLVPWHAGIAGWHLGVLALLGLVPAIDLATALVNRDAMEQFGATTLPGLELRDGVPPELRTLVVVPVLLTTPAAIAEQVARLEILHLASPDGDLRFALLSDWVDAASETLPADVGLLEDAIGGIAALNARHPAAIDGPRFLLLHRRRAWSDRQGQWMGWERKRGKLHELNRLLRGASDTSFIATGGAPPAVPDGVRFVITLDADTRLPRDAARRLVGKLAHPLNRPRFDPASGRVVEGHGVLQPRVTPSLSVGVEGSLFQRVFSSSSGIDPYAGAVSDVYQDLFGEGSYAGKGIYDVDAFEAALAGRVPEDSLLSHDLFEGIFARAGLVSDIEVVEEFPARYDVAISRQHRWARGDWQLLPWIFGRGATDGTRRTTAIPLIGLWKMSDNLRRTLSAPSAVLALVAGWMLPHPAALAWTAFVVATIALPTLLPVMADLVPRRAGISWRSHVFALAESLRMAALQTALLLTFLAHQAWSMTDAIGRTAYRLATGRGRMLEWLTAAQAQSGRQAEISGYYARMTGAVVVGIGAAGAVAATSGAPGLWLALPFVLAWIASPWIARRVSRSPEVAGRITTSESDKRALRLIARRTWRFFATFVTPADHSLPPDNFQEDPKPVLARRTSPTNMGLYLLSVVAARDFGWIGTTETVERLEATLATMDRLQRHRGHFYNWYATADLRPLDPRYVSAVDSGNLAGHLLVVARACSQAADGVVAQAAAITGIEDALALMREAQREAVGTRRVSATSRRQLDEMLDAFAVALRDLRLESASRDARWEVLLRAASMLADTAQSLAEQRGADGGDETVIWAEAILETIQSHLRDSRDDVRARLASRLAALEATARRMVEAMEFGFLLDPDRRLLSIGYLVPEGTLDSSCYDLLASEARLASFVAIAKGDIPPRHWFRLGRSIAPVGSQAALVSWSGSMFEYLMPSLVMRAPRQPARADQPHDRAPADRLRQVAICPGGSPSPRTTRAISSSPTSTPISACPASA
jgi:cyclic beta-1,2-glucan synthetase